MNDIKELIQEVKNESHLVKMKREELERLKRLCEVAGINYEGERVDGTKDNNRHEKAIINYIEYKEELTNFILSTMEKRSLLCKYIDTLKDTQSIEVMYAYCISDLSFKHIAKEMYMTIQRIYQIYNQAIEEINHNLREDFKRF